VYPPTSSAVSAAVGCACLLLLVCQGRNARVAMTVLPLSDWQDVLPLVPSQASLSISSQSTDMVQPRVWC
jgi:hypothetical protein